MDPKIYQIAKLNGNNYFLWRLKIEMLLQREKVWNVIEEPTPEPPTEEWKSKDQCARATIGLTLEDKILVTIANQRTAKQVWYHLKTTYEHKGLASRLHLLKKLYGSRYDEYGNMEEYLNSILETLERLRAIGESVAEHHLVVIVLCGLPDIFSPLVTALEMKDGDGLKLEFVMERLRDEANRQENPKREDQNVAMSTFQPTNRRRIVCHNCGGHGHIRRNCTQNYLPGNGVGQMEPNSAAFSTYCSIDNREVNHEVWDYQADSEWALTGCQTSTGNTTDEWLIDSGASCHMSHIREHFEDFTELKEPIWVKIANGETLKATGEGRIQIYPQVKNQKPPSLKLKQVLYVPALKFQLLSVPKLCEDEYVVNFQGKICSIYLHGNLYGIGTQGEKTFVLNGHTNPRKNEHYASPCVHVWHERLGHRAIEGIRRMHKNKQVKDLNIAPCNHNNFCKSCQMGSMRQVSFKTARQRETVPYKVLVTDVFGPITPMSMGGKQCFLMITDDASNFTSVYLLRNKSEATDNIVKFIKEGRNKFNYYPEILRSDEGEEFMCSKLEQFLKDVGIKHQTSVVNTPQQNGKAERKNLSLMNMTRTMLKSSGLPKSLWGEAISTATYVLNQLNHSEQEKTPHEVWHGYPPSLKHLKVFGCPAFAYVHKIKRQKLSDTAIPGVMVGYGINKKCFRVWVPGTQKIINAISVTFNEPLPAHNSQRIFSQENRSSSEDSQIDMILCEPELETNTTVTSPRPRRSERVTKGIPATRWTY